MPESSEKIWKYLGEEKSITDELYSELKFDDLSPDQEIRKPTPLFPRVDLQEFIAGEKEESQPAQNSKEGKMDQISFE